MSSSIPSLAGTGEVDNRLPDLSQLWESRKVGPNLSWDHVTKLRVWWSQTKLHPQPIATCWWDLRPCKPHLLPTTREAPDPGLTEVKLVLGSKGLSRDELRSMCGSGGVWEALWSLSLGPGQDKTAVGDQRLLGPPQSDREGLEMPIWTLPSSPDTGILRDTGANVLWP